MKYRAFAGGKEIKDFYVGGQQIKEIYGGNTLMWKKETERMELFGIRYRCAGNEYETRMFIEDMGIRFDKIGVSIRYVYWTSGSFPVWHHENVAYSIAVAVGNKTSLPEYIRVGRESRIKNEDGSFGEWYKMAGDSLYNDGNGIFSMRMSGEKFYERTLELADTSLIEYWSSSNVSVFNNVDDLETWIMV